MRDDWGTNFPDFPRPLPPIRARGVLALFSFGCLGTILFYGALIVAAAYALRWALGG